MLIACWSAKGGVGTSVVAGGLALSAVRAGGDALVVDLAGEAHEVLGLGRPDGPGVEDWLAAGPEVPPDALGRLEHDVCPGLSILHRGGASAAPRFPDGAADPAEAVDRLGELLAADGRTVVVDCGLLLTGDQPEARVAARAPRSLVITRLCYLGLRRLSRPPVPPSGAIVVAEPGRALDTGDVERVTGVPVLAEVPFDPAVARAVDAGLLVSRLPRSLFRSLRRAA